MCGIAGLLKLGESNLNPKKTLIELLTKIQQRGTDAVGACWEVPGDDRTFYLKQPGLVAGFNPDIPDNSFLVMGHVRNATHGSPANEENNHPIFGKRYIITHNGVVSAKKLDGYQLKGETDTEIMLSYIERDGWDGVPETPGTKSVAVWDMEKKELMLYTSTDALSVILVDNAIVWCSTMEPLIDLVNNDEYPFLNINKLKVKKNTAYIFKPFVQNVDIIEYTIKTPVVTYEEWRGWV